MSKKIKFVKFDDGVTLDYGILKNGEIIWKSDGWVSESRYIHDLYQSGKMKTISEEEYQVNLEKSPEEVANEIISSLLDEEFSSETTTQVLNKVLSIVMRIEEKIDMLLNKDEVDDSFVDDFFSMIGMFVDSVTTEPLTDNQKRAKLIEEAKELTNQLVENAESYHSKTCHVVFYTNYESGKIHVHYKSKSNFADITLWKAGSKCNPNDVFNEDIGKLIAISRLLDIEIDPKFLNVPQPTEYANGMLITFPKDDEFYRKVVYRIEDVKAEKNNLTIVVNNAYADFLGEVAHINFLDQDSWSRKLLIIDDTHADYELTEIKG